jgi:Ca2+-binding EF-hand superfamily protein
MTFSLVATTLLVFGMPEDPPKKKFAGQGGDSGQMLKRLDKDGDGTLSKEEIEAAPERAQQFLKRMDSNGDGSVDKSEIGTALKRFGSKKKGEGDPPAKEKAAKKEAGKSPEGTPDRAKMIAERVKQLDKDGDGALSKSEAEGPLADNFDRLDRNGDGKLTKDEWMPPSSAAGKGKAKPAGKNPPPSEDAKKPKDGDPPVGKKGKRKGDAKKGGEGLGLMMRNLDADQDGKISKDEAKGPLTEAFTYLDRNRDGFLDSEELASAREKMKGAGKGMVGNAPSLADQFNQQDSDADGRLDKSEAKGVLAEKFADLDTNKDGKLTRQEVETGLKK